jgi:hypothetical protein
MKEVVRMALLISSTIATLACQGCVQAPNAYVQAEAPAAPQSLGMTLAAPSPFGAGVLSSKTSRYALPMIDGAPTTFSMIESAVATVENRPLLAQAPTSFDVAPTFSKQSEVTVEAWTGNDALLGLSAERARARLVEPTEVEKNIAAEIAFSAPKEITGFGFDLGVAPRLSVREEGEFLTQRFGGEVRIGQNLNVLNAKDQPEGWYVFAGADGEALIWDAGERSSLTPNLGDMALREHVTVGDLQAGVSVQRGGGQLSLSYIRREVKYEDRNGGFKDNEDFAGVSFTLRR